MSKQAVIVGVTGAFGTAIAGHLIFRDIHVVGVARDEEALRLLAAKLGNRFNACACDIGGSEAVEAIEGSLTEPVAMVVHSVGLAVAGGAQLFLRRC